LKKAQSMVKQHSVLSLLNPSISELFLADVQTVLDAAKVAARRAMVQAESPPQLRH
jgi:hypothetical protein